MSRSRLRGLGLVTATLLAASLTLSTPASAEGTTGTVAGTVTDNGLPVAASVTVYASDYSFLTNGYTNEGGQYFLSGIPEGSNYIVSVSAFGHPTQFAHGKTSEAEADLLTVTADQTTTVDEQLLPTGTVTGHFLDQAGNPVSASVTAQRDSDGSASYGSTDPSTGAYTLHVFAGDHRVSFTTNTTQYAYGTRDYFSAALIPVAVGDTVTVDDTKLPTGTIAGRVTYSDGSPAADVNVSLQNDTGSSSYSTTDADGNYTVADVLPGAYNIQFALPGGATEYAHGKFDRASADTITVTADATTTVDEQLPATGVIAGRFTDQAGNGVPGVQVFASTSGLAEDQSLSASTDENGDYRIARAFPGHYTVQFQNDETQLFQFAYGRVTPETADPITVTADQTTTVNDQRLPTGSIKFTAKDSLTGAPINDFFVQINPFRFGDTQTGEVVVDNLGVGTYPVSAGATGYAYQDKAANVTVTAGQQTLVELTLVPTAKVTTKVVDRKTGQGVANVCVFPATKTAFVFPDGCARSDENGNVTLELDVPGTVNLFALPQRDSAYGAQWVGATGGTGTQESAAKVVAKSGQTVAAPRIKLDKKGTITGKVTSTSGPIVRGTVGIVGPDLGAGVDTRYSAIAADGTYTVDFLGPYEWPLLFGSQNHAYQWSGGVGNRLKAALVPVNAGKTTKFNYKLKAGTDVTITYNYPGRNGRFVVMNGVTGDPMAVADSGSLPGSLQVRVIGPQTVKVACFCDSLEWNGGTSFATATPVSIPATGSKQIVFVRP